MRARLTVLALAIAALASVPASASAAFGFLPGSEGFDVDATKVDGSFASQAGSHPFAFKVKVGLQSAAGFSDGDLRDLRLELPPGLLVNPTAVEECSAALFHTPRSSPYETSLSGESCPDKSQVGVAAIHTNEGGGSTRYFGLFNLTAPYGSPAAIGFSPYGVPVVLTPRVREADAGLSFDLQGLPQSFDLQRLELTIWGTPWAFDHDPERGNCLNEADPVAYHGELSTPAGPGGAPPFHAGTCTIGTPQVVQELGKSFVTMPTTPCGAPLSFSLSADSWEGGSAVASAQAHGSGGTLGVLSGCNSAATIPKAQLSTDRTGVGSGFVFNLDVNDGGGILNPGGIARPAIKQAIVSLPEGLTINPSLGAGLGVCTEADFARESVDSVAGAGCPNQSKVGTIEVQGMLGLPGPVKGSLFVAEPYRNPFGTLLALYMVARDPRRGLLVKSEGKIEPDLRTGRLRATFDDLPRLLYTHFALSFREGQRSVIVSPPTCGNYPTEVEMASYAQPGVFSHDSTSYFPIAHGAEGGACPGAALPPFAPALEAGSLNIQAGYYSPFYLHMARTDAEQEITSYSATFPPGLLAKLAGIPFCPEAAIEAAKGRTGTEEAAHPSCPAASEIGRTLAGYGLGSTLAYAPGRLYLAGPYHGSAISVVAIDSALVGPFDLGVVVVRSAIRVDRRTAQASIDSAGSDPIPHILKGIPIHLRDIRVYVDRPGFTVNPTSCDPLATLSTLTGAGADPFSAADDVAATASDRFQLANCLALGFKPRLALSLRGGTRRSQFPSLRAVYTPRPGNANVSRASVALPHTEFLAQGHIREICTLRQFRGSACPPSSIYGHAAAFTPLLSEPLRGPVYLRSSATHPLPDMVVALHGPGSVAIDLEGRVDSARGGGLRASFEVLPDAPVSKFVLTLQGGKKGLLENSANACAAPAFATARFVGHNNQTEVLRPQLRAKCAEHPQRQGHPR